MTQDCKLVNRKHKMQTQLQTLHVCDISLSILSASSQERIRGAHTTHPQLYHWCELHSCSRAHTHKSTPIHFPLLLPLSHQDQEKPGTGPVKSSAERLFVAGTEGSSCSLRISRNGQDSDIEVLFVPYFIRIFSCWNFANQTRAESCG